MLIKYYSDFTEMENIIIFDQEFTPRVSLSLNKMFSSLTNIFSPELNIDNLTFYVFN